MQYLPTLLSFLIILPAAAMCLLPMRHQLRYPLKRIILFLVNTKQYYGSNEKYSVSI